MARHLATAEHFVVVMLFLAAGAGYLCGTMLALLLDRAYTGAPWAGPLSPCRTCDGPRLWWTGTLGYALAGGRCRCGMRLPAPLLYLPLLAMVTAILIALGATDARQALLTALFAVVLLALTSTDIERRLLPNRLMYPALAVALLLSWAWPHHSAPQMLAGGAVGFAVMFVMFLISPNLGFGDVKLAGLLGLVTGLPAVVGALAIATIAGGVGAAILLATRKVGRKGTIAYGPYLALGALLGMLMN
jgi:prepilin signal peptidase PulO-like enzyme (type II secretory pathway)